ncbi:hypothetical protein [Acetobacter fallax]|nr:hypothetical protein [Acetobacter fallax]
MAKKDIKDDVPIISVRTILIMHGVLIIVVAMMVWIDWSLPS